MWIGNSVWPFPIILTFHALGMVLVVGILTMLNLRTLGIAAMLPITVFNQLKSVIGVAFGINFLSGVLLFIPRGTELIVNIAFQLKMTLIVLGGIASWALLRSLNRTPPHAHKAGSGTITGKERLIAWVSLVLWTGAIVSGRVIAYIMSEAPI
jgi:hypothetical protein